jgi:hypothetical protein
MRENVDFVFLSLAYFTYHDVLQLHPFTFKPHVIIPFSWWSGSIDKVPA